MTHDFLHTANLVNLVIIINIFVIVHKVNEHYGFINDRLLAAIYGRCKHHCNRPVSEEYGKVIAAKMNATPMEDFFHKTKQLYSVLDCTMDNVDCREQFEIIGTLNGHCLSYNPHNNGQMFARDSVLRITLSGNNTGNRYCKNFCSKLKTYHTIKIRSL